MPQHGVIQVEDLLRQEEQLYVLVPQRPGAEGRAGSQRHESG